MPGRRTDLDQDPLADYPERMDGERDAVLLGRDGRGGLRYFDEADRVVATATDDGDGLDVDWTSGRVLEAEESLASVLDDVGQRVGWDALSSYAREHLDDG